MKGLILLLTLTLGSLMVRAKICLFYNVTDVTLKAGAIFGFLAGVVGVAGWITFFSLHPNPPSINKTMFFSQLIFVHIIFGIVMVELMEAI